MGALDGKVAVVTGAGSGIGRASAQRMAAEGAHVVAVDLGEDSAQATADELGGTAVAGDVSHPELWDAVRAAADEQGGMDVVHLNAGVYGYTGPIDEMPDGFPAQVLYEFRLYSLGTQLVLWTVIAVVFGSTVQRLLDDEARRVEALV